MGLGPWYLHRSQLCSIGFSRKAFLGWKEILHHGPEEYFFLIFEGVEVEQTELKASSSWLRQGRNKENNVL